MLNPNSKNGFIASKGYYVLLTLVILALDKLRGKGHSKMAK